jgi:16S rRNA (guanine527-N7)-methyltransferase
MEYISKFREMLLAENQKHNLVSRRTLEEDFDKHISDSQEILKYTSLDNCRIADMGSGAGFPGLILAMHCPTAQFILVESDSKKSAFLETVALELDLGNVKVVTCRLEKLGHDSSFRETFDIVTARALAALNVLLEYGIPLLKSGGIGWFWKGSKAEEEVKQAQRALQVLHTRVESIYWYKLIEQRDRALVKVVKESPTPAQYPRRTGIPSKRPL